MDEKLFDRQKIMAKLQDPAFIRQTIFTIIPYVTIYVVFLLLANSLGITKEWVQELFAGLGGVLIPAFIAMQLLASLTPLPDLPFLAAGILFFKPWLVFILILVGMWLGTLINFTIARRLGRNLIQKRYPETSQWIDRFTGKYGILTIIIARNFSFVTFDVVAYAAGVSNIKPRKFLLASVAGLMPVALNATLMGIAVTSTLEQGGLSYASVGRGIGVFALTLVLSISFAFIAHRVNLYIEKQHR